MIFSRNRLAGLCCAVLIAVPMPALAQDESEDPVVAVVNGEEIRHSEVLAAAQQLPEEYRSQVGEFYPMLVDRMVDMELVGQGAREAGLADHAEVERRLEEMRIQIMRDVYLEQKVDDYLTEERLREAYEDRVDGETREEEIRARHILVEDRETAEELIAELDEGAEFVRLAESHSIGPSASTGGDLGFFGRGAMVEPFDQAVFALEEGEYTQEPVETQFGWHVIQKVGSRTSSVPSFEDLRDELHRELEREAIQAALAELRQDADIETYPERAQ
jgi:peptidyl-prolyl cis-trans isomerase C